MFRSDSIALSCCNLLSLVCSTGQSSDTHSLYCSLSVLPQQFWHSWTEWEIHTTVKSFSWWFLNTMKMHAHDYFVVVHTFRTWHKCPYVHSDWWRRCERVTVTAGASLQQFWHTPSPTVTCSHITQCWLVKYCPIVPWIRRTNAKIHM